MSIILKALKKIQEQEAEQRTGQEAGSSSGNTSAPVQAASGPPPTSVPSPAESRNEPLGAQRVGAAPPPFVRHTFGLGPKVLLGLLFIVGIATAGWFASSIYHVNSEQGPENAASQTPPVIEEPVIYVKAVEVTAAPGEAAALEPEVPEPTPSVVEETVQPEPLKAPAAVTAIDVPHADSPERSAPAMKEAKPEKKEKPKFKINAIAWKNAEPRAIVNMQSVYEGGVIEGATVVAIKRKMIVFEYEGETFEVRFGL